MIASTPILTQSIYRLSQESFRLDIYLPSLELKRIDERCTGTQEIDRLLSDLESPYVGSTSELSKSAEANSEEAIRKELEYFKRKAIEQDIEIFEMRALLQSGKGLSNILNLKQLLDTFMAVVREKYSAVNTAVLLKDDLENANTVFV